MGGGADGEAEMEIERTQADGVRDPQKVHLKRKKEAEKE